jgi:UPF0755 protein
MSNDRDVVKKLEEALKLIDDSNLPPAPDSGRAVPVQSERRGVSMQKPPLTDKFGIPIKPPPTRSDVKPYNASRPAAPGIKPQGASRPAASGSSPSNKTRPAIVAGAPLKSRVPADSSADVTAYVSEDKDEPDVGPPEFRMKFDFESAYKDVPSNNPLGLRRERRTGLVGGLLLAIFIICVSLVLASAVWMATVDVLGFAAGDELVDVFIPPDFTMEGVTDILYEAGLIRYRSLFTIYAEYSSAEEKITSGSFVLNRNYDYRALVQGMTARAGVRVETTVTIPEGFTLAQIFNLLEREDVCSADDLWEAATNHNFNFWFLDSETLGNRLRLEGFLFPDTYNFYKNSTPTQAILRMLREFDRRFREEYVERAAFLGYSVHEIIIIASLIEREAGDDDERSRIAAVIFNRLDNPNFPRLEIDATIHYAIMGTSIPFSTQLDSEFNTYIHEGLPPGAIANPGIASIRAALYPDSTNEYFYALNRQGTHNFFTNYNDHVNFVNSPEYGG